VIETGSKLPKVLVIQRRYKMPINKITIQNYKSLQDLPLELKDLNVFIGPNNAGKSNIIECLSFLSEFVKEGHEGRNVIHRRGGFEQVVFNGDTGQTILIDLQGSIHVGNSYRKFGYELQLSYVPVNYFRNKKEVFRLLDGSQETLLEYSQEKGSVVKDESGKQTGGIGGNVDQSHLSFFGNPDYYPILGHFAQDVKRWGIFRFLPTLMRQSLPIRKEFELEETGMNLSVVLHTLQSEYPEKFKEIVEILKSAVGEIEEVTTGLLEHKPGESYVRIREKMIKIPISAWGMSDGTLGLLAYLATIYQPDPPTLLSFEEPENYIHPHLLGLVVELLKNASKRSQILVSTHSPYLVDLLEPEDIFIVEKKNGKTEVKKAEEKKRIREALKNLGLGEMWYAGDLGGVP